jgi:hypothetical protein
MFTWRQSCFVSGSTPVRLNSDERLDDGSRNPIMRMFFDGAIRELEAKLPKPLENHFGLGRRVPAARHVIG